MSRAAKQEHELQIRLVENLEKWERAGRIRSFVDAVVTDAGARPDADLKQVGAWARWARRHADSLDPLTKPGTISLECQPERVAGIQLGRDDDNGSK
ncbi:hypothetical protein D3C79_985820 [compost metagenome]